MKKTFQDYIKTLSSMKELDMEITKMKEDDKNRPIVEISMPRLYKYYKNHDTGTITAYRNAGNCGCGDKHTKKEKDSRNAHLKGKLIMLGYSITKIEGWFIENYNTPNAEQQKIEAFFVVDMQDTGKLKENLIKLGREFEQDCITYSRKTGDYYVISTNECSKAYPGNGKIGVEVKLRKQMFGRNGEFYSVVEGRPFIFKENVRPLERISDYSPTQIRSFYEFSKMKAE